MTRIARTGRKLLHILPRAGIILLLLAAPVLAVPSLLAGPAATIEAPALKKTGAGLFLLVSLRRG